MQGVLLGAVVTTHLFLLTTIVSSGTGTLIQMGLEDFLGIYNYSAEDYVDRITRSMTLSLIIPKGRNNLIGSSSSKALNSFVDEIINMFVEEVIEFVKKIKRLY